MWLTLILASTLPVVKVVLLCAVGVYSTHRVRGLQCVAAI